MHREQFVVVAVVAAAIEAGLARVPKADVPALVRGGHHGRHTRRVLPMEPLGDVLYLKKMIFNNYRKSLDSENKIIENKNLQKFICKIEKNLKIIGITYTGRIFKVNWEENINTDYKLDNKILGNIDPNEILNFHHINKETKNYLCTLDSDGRFKKVLLDRKSVV